MVLYSIKYKRRIEMLEKVKRIIEKIEQNDYLTAGEAFFISELKSVLDYVEGEFGPL